MPNKCRHQYIEVTPATDKNKTYMCKKCGKVRQPKGYKDYLSESWLDVWIPVELDDIDYINNV